MENTSDKFQHSISRIFKRHFRALFFMVLGLFLLFTGLSVYWIVRGNIDATLDATHRTLSASESHLLALAYTGNTEALRMVLADVERQVGRVRLEYLPPGASPPVNSFSLRFAEHDFGSILPRYDWTSLIDFRLVALLLLSVAGLFALFFYFYRSASTHVISVFQKTEEVMKESEAKQRENLALRTQRELASQVYHDIASPLTTLKLVTEISGSHNQYSQLIKSAIERIESISQDLHATGRRSHEPADNAVRPVALSSEIREILAEKKFLLEKSGVQVESDIDDSPCYSQLDPGVFKRVVSNLINNSAEAMSEDGGHINVSLRSNGGTNSVIVRDNGRGMPEHILSRVGQRGLSHGKKKTSHGGLGLGLYHARQSVEGWNGRLEINSVEGSGTEVILEIPCSGSPASSEGSTLAAIAPPD